MKRTNKMLSPFLGIIGACLALMGLCRAENLASSSTAPLSIVYTVYPYYNSDALLGIWKAEDPTILGASLAANILTRGRESETGQQNRITTTDSGSRDESSENSNIRVSNRNDSNEKSKPRNEQATEITYWPPVQRGATPQSRLQRINAGLRS